MLGLDVDRVFDGFFFAAGASLLYLGALLTMSIARSMGVAGGAGLMVLCRLLLGWHRFVHQDARHIVNVTLNTARPGYLAMDTLVSDQLVLNVWTNPYLVRLILAAAKQCTETDPVIRMRDHKYDLYKAVYDPLVNIIAERVNNDGSIGLSLSSPAEMNVVRHRFVVALTYEPCRPGRLRHLRALVVSERELLDVATRTTVPNTPPIFERPEHALRWATIQAVARSYVTNPEHFGQLNVWRPR